MLAVQQQSEAELAQANQQVEVTETAQQAATQLGGPANIAAVQESAVTVAGAGVLLDSGLAQGSKLQQQINQLKSGYTVQDLKKPKERQAVAEKKPARGAKKAAPAKTSTAKPASAAKSRGTAPAPASAVALDHQSAPKLDQGIDLQASVAASQAKEEDQVNNQADEILDQIKSAAAGIRGISGGNVEGLDETSLQAAMKGMNLLQLDSQISDHELPDENAQIAMDYLAQQFPEEYPRDTKPKGPPPMVPTQDEVDAAEKQAMVAYAQRVAAEATESRDQVLQGIAAKKEAAALAKMGMEGEPVTLQLSSENLLQIGADIKFDADALEAQAYLEQQFPDEYPREQVKQQAPPQPSEAEIEEKQRQEALQYAEEVTAAATESRDQVV